MLASLWSETLLHDLMPHSAYYEAALVQRERLCNEACNLEWRIATTPVFTLAGYAAKVASIAAAGFDIEVLIQIAWQLGREATRLGIDELPPLLLAA